MSKDILYKKGEQTTAECGHRRHRRLLMRVPWASRPRQGRIAFTAV